MQMKVPILPEPPRPDVCRICPQCGGWFALKLESTRADKIVGRVEVYRCTHCDRVREYAAQLPGHVV